MFLVSKKGHVHCKFIIGLDEPITIGGRDSEKVYTWQENWNDANF